MIKYNYTVYIHINKTNGKVYVGITSMSVKARWLGGSGYKSNKHFCSAIQKYGWSGFIHVVFRTHLSKEEAACMEQQLITSYRADNPSYGYNKSKGGEGGNNQGKNSGTATYYKIHSAEYRKAHKEELRSRAKLHRESHKEELRSYMKSYQETHKAELKAYRDSHKDAIREKDKIWREEHKEERIAKQRKYYEEHREELRAKMRDYMKAHAEERRIYRKSYYQEHKNKQP